MLVLITTLICVGKHKEKQWTWNHVATLIKWGEFPTLVSVAEGTTSNAY